MIIIPLPVTQMCSRAITNLGSRAITNLDTNNGETHQSQLGKWKQKNNNPTNAHPSILIKSTNPTHHKTREVDLISQHFNGQRFWAPTNKTDGATLRIQGDHRVLWSFRVTWQPPWPCSPKKAREKRTTTLKAYHTTGRAQHQLGGSLVSGTAGRKPTGAVLAWCHREGGSFTCWDTRIKAETL